MSEDKNALSVILILLLAGVLTTCASAETSVYLDASALDGTRETAAEIGKVAKLADSSATQDAKGTIIVAGRLDNKHVAPLVKASGMKVDTKWIGDQGFYIKTIPADNGKAPRILVTAGTKVGVLYGLIRIREEMKKRHEKNPLALKLDLRDRPAFKYRSAGPYANFKQYWGSFGGEDFTMEDFPELFESKDAYNKWVKGSYERLEKLKKMVAEDHKRGTKRYLHIGAPIWPKHTKKRDDKCRIGKGLKKLHPEIFATPAKGKGKRSQYYCWSSKILRDIVLKNFDRIFAKVPDLDGLVIVIHNGGNGYLCCRCPKCSKTTPEEQLKELIASLTKVMRKYNPNAKIILRDWKLDQMGIKNVDKLADVLPDDVMYYTKLTVPPGNDYLWYDHFSPRINTPRLLVFGCNTFHANDHIPGHMFYLGGWMKARALKLIAAGVYGCWSGNSQFGCEDLNPTAVAATAWDPATFDPLEHLTRWAVDNFGKEAGGHMVKALYESYKITDYLVVDEHATNTSQVFHWDPDRPTQYTMGVGQSKAVKDVNLETFDKLRPRYEGTDALKRAERLLKEITAAQAMLPKNEKLIRMLKWAKVTDLLVKATRNYHMALLNYNLYKNILSSNPKEAQAALKRAESYIAPARLAKNEYVKIYITIPETYAPKWIQGKRYSAFVGGEVENGYDAIMAAATGKKASYVATGSSSLKSKDWPKIAAAKKVWRQGETLVIPDVLRAKSKKAASSITIKLAADLSKGSLLRIESEIRGKSGWKRLRQSSADIYIDGKLIGQIRRRVESYMRHDYPHFKHATPAKTWRAFIVPPLSGKTHTITIKAVAGQKKNPAFCIDSMKLYLPY
ncbi:MAG: hypothetical protein K8S55_06210 [Phycisphaerae bacterium]|nr:hypothetical protein [Phycisphaerae bacterium]